jgi:hypothetical protein
MINPLNYEFNKENKKLFLEHTAPDARDAMEKFLNATIHVSHDEFIKQIKDKLDEVIALKTGNRSIFVYIDMNKEYEYKSNYWIYTYIKHFLNEKYIVVEIIKSLNDIKVQNNDIVLLIDDCIYSGWQMSKTIADIENINLKKVKLILFVPFISSDGLKNIKEKLNDNKLLKTCEIIISKNIEIFPLSKYLSLEEGMTIFQYYIYNTKIYSIESYTKNQLQKYAIYFDHKVGDWVSSFPPIYSGLVPNKKNKKIKTEIEKLKTNINKDNSSIAKKIEDLEKSYDFFPLLTNCEHIQKPDKDESTCPYPPYKKGYQTYLDKIIDLKQQYNSFKIPSDKPSVKFPDDNLTNLQPFEYPNNNLKNNIDLLEQLINDHFKKLNLLHDIIKKNI